MSVLINQLRETAQEILESNPNMSSLLFKAATAIEEYRAWLEIVQQRAAENYENIDDIKSMLQSISELLRMMAGKY